MSPGSVGTRAQRQNFTCAPSGRTLAVGRHQHAFLTLRTLTIDRPSAIRAQRRPLPRALLLLGDMTVTTCTTDSETDPRLGAQSGRSARRSSAAQLVRLLAANLRKLFRTSSEPYRPSVVGPPRAPSFVSRPRSYGSGRRVLLPLLRTRGLSRTAHWPRHALSIATSLGEAVVRASLTCADHAAQLYYLTVSVLSLVGKDRVKCRRLPVRIFPLYQWFCCARWPVRGPCAVARVAVPEQS